MAKTIAQLRKAHPTKYVFTCSFAGPEHGIDDYSGILPVASDAEMQALSSQFRKLLLSFQNALPHRKPPQGMVRVAKNKAEESE